MNCRFGGTPSKPWTASSWGSGSNQKGSFNNCNQNCMLVPCGQQNLPGENPHSSLSLQQSNNGEPVIHAIPEAPKPTIDKNRKMSVHIQRKQFVFWKQIIV